MSHARSKKEEGNKYFKAEKYDEAIECYAEALTVCPYKYEDDRVRLFSNLALTFSKMGQWMEAYTVALSGLALNEYHVKLSNVLSQCHSKLTLKDITKNIVEKAKNSMIRKVHYVNLFGLAYNAKMAYTIAMEKQRAAELDKMDEAEQKQEMNRMVQSMSKTPFVQRQTALQHEAVNQGT